VNSALQPAQQAHAHHAPLRRSWLAAVVGAMLVATLAAAAYVQSQQLQLLNAAVRNQDDYLQVSLAQLEIDYLRLLAQWKDAAQAPAGLQPAEREALQLRYDIFVSRVSMLDSERTARVIRDRRELEEARGAIERFVERADVYLAAAPGGAAPPLDAPALSALLGELNALGPPIHDLALDASHHLSAQVSERNMAVRRHNRVGIALTLLLSVTTLGFALITMRQMRELERRRRGLQELAETLHEAQREAESASQAKSAFLANMSHELRTPFQGVLGMLSLLRESGLNARQVDYVRTASESADHLLVILNDILDMSKLESGTLQLAAEPVDLRRLVADVEALMRPQAAAKGLAWRAGVAADVPARVLADATRVRQVLFNLTSNALKFSDAGSVMLDVHRRGGEIAFTVADTGIGMDDAALARLFQRFSQADQTPSRRHGGTGLGLEISRNLARLMGGDIDVASRPGEGSTFVFRFPLVEAPAPAADAADARHTRASGLRVLVAEDHPVNRKYLAALLDSLGHEAHFAEDGQEAVQALRRERYDAVLMDLHMPVLDGIAATQAIRTLPGAGAGVPIIALTADAFAETRERCLAAGMDGFLVKPVNAAELGQALLRRAERPLAGGPAAAPAPPAAAPTDGDDALIDHDRLGQVRVVLPGDRFGNLAASLLRDSRDAARTMRDAMLRSDHHTLRESAHRSKGAALSLGLKALAGAAEDLQKAAGHADDQTLAALLLRFERLIGDSAQELRRLGLVSAA
jgi:signal transduction histidine kinase/ActR/RegA family two-component response regulator/HPt (histidine-containing phosphotransfer) domain-containing protein